MSRTETSSSTRALRHVYSSVPEGRQAGRGSGFQTVAASPGLDGADLAALEKASFYALSRDRRGAGAPLPVRHTYFRLPSGRLALGRTEDHGTDALGREGNYLARHRVVEAEALAEAASGPWAVLDGAWWESAVPPPGDLDPEEVPLRPETAEIAALEALPPELRTALAAAAADGGEKPVLLVTGAETAAALLRALSALMDPEERLGCTFCTHFYESGGLRSLFRVVAVAGRGEIPGARDQYRLFDLETGDYPATEPQTPYSTWLSACVRRGAWEEPPAFNAATRAIRREEPGLSVDGLSATGRLLLWEREGESLAARLSGPGLADYLQELPVPRKLLAALLARSPAELCGTEAPTEETDACLEALRAWAPDGAWRSWARKWKSDPLLASFGGDTAGMLDRLRAAVLRPRK